MENACCAHQRVSYRTCESRPGLVVKAWWECDSGCGQLFTMTERPDVAPPKEAEDWRVVTSASRKGYPHYTDGAIRGIQLVSSLGTDELTAALGDGAKQEVLRLKLGEKTNPNWLHNRIAEQLYGRGEIDEEALDRADVNGAPSTSPPSDAAPDQKEYKRGEIDACNGQPPQEGGSVYMEGWTAQYNRTHKKLAHPEDAQLEAARSDIKTFGRAPYYPSAAPRPDKASQGSTVAGGERPAQVEDAQGGPWITAYAKHAPHIYTVLIPDKRFAFTGDRQEAEAVRDALNQIKGGET